MSANPSKRLSMTMPKALVKRSTCASRSGTVNAMWSIPGVIMSTDGGRLEQLDEVARRVEGEHLSAARTCHDVVAEADAFVGESGDFAVDVVHDEVDAVPPSWARSFSVGHRSAGRALRTRQQQAQVAASHVCERRTRYADSEPEVVGVEVDARGDVLDQIAHVHDLFISHDG